MKQGDTLILTAMRNEFIDDLNAKIFSKNHKETQ